MRSKRKKEIEERLPDFPRIPGADDAILGWFSGVNSGGFVYSYEALHRICREGGMPAEEVDEWVQFNIESAYQGPNTPIVLRSIE